MRNEETVLFFARFCCLEPTEAAQKIELHSQEGKTVAAHVLREAQALADRQAACGAQAPALKW